MRLSEWRTSLVAGQLLALGLSICLLPSPASAAWSSSRKHSARERTRDLWYHGFNNYMIHAFPLDELRPLSCSGRGPDWHDPTNIATNDVDGNFSVTLVDSLDTFVIFNDLPGFDAAVQNAVDWVQFDVNSKPQVFETTIRVLGGLLSAHIFASDKSHPLYLKWYKGELLQRAHDLGERLLPAFGTPTGLPFARINLRHGVMHGETFDTCTAGAGSLIIEFGTLSRLTGDPRFEQAAHKAFFALWNRRSDLNLVGNTINAVTGTWTAPEISGVGAGIDSFFEYAFKWFVLSGEIEFLDVWHEAYAAIMRYSRSPDGFWYRSVNIHSGETAYWMADSLSAFWPGLQVLAGDVNNAIKAHLSYWNLWKQHSGIPEVYDTNFRTATSHQYPLRPEFIESTWYLYRATHDEFYLDVAERVLDDITRRAEVECGLTGIMDLRSNERDDRMESFVLSETLKYLYLVFDEENPIHRDDSNYVFTTEGHILTLPIEHQRPLSPIRRRLRRFENLTCPAYQAPVLAFHEKYWPSGIIGGISDRPDVDYIREYIGAPTSVPEKSAWSTDGWCEMPRPSLYSFDFVLSGSGKKVDQVANPGPDMISKTSDGFMLLNVTGVRVHIVSRLDGHGYDITKLGPYQVRTGQAVYISDPDLIQNFNLGTGTSQTDELLSYERQPTVPLRFFVEETVFSSNDPSTFSTEFAVMAYTSVFGGDPAVPADSPGYRSPLRFIHREAVPVRRPRYNHDGCNAYEERFDDDVVFVKRGGCTFLEKLVLARDAGAAGVIVLNNDDVRINPSASEEEEDAAGSALKEVALVLVGATEGGFISEALDALDVHGSSRRLFMVVDPERGAWDGKVHSDQQYYPPLYVNGHPLLNTRIIMH